MWNADYLTRLPYLVAALIPALTFHEWGHAYVAYKCGDSTAKLAGRLTLNPLAHLDPLGTLAIFLIGFGWAKPVPTNPSRFKARYSEVWVGIAGITMNWLLALFFALLLRFNVHYVLGAQQASLFFNIFQISLYLNLMLLFFNLIPLGPLDGTHVVSRLLPLRASLQYSMWNQQYGSLILLAIILLDSLTNVGVLRFLILFPTEWTARLLLS